MIKSAEKKINNSVDDFLMKGTLTPEDYPVQLVPGENWIGYFLKDSYSPLVALSPVLNYVNRIEARKWYMYRGKFGEWIGVVQQGETVSMNYGEMYKVHYYGPSASFSYSFFGTPLSRYSPAETNYYTFTESPAYLAAVVNDPGWETVPDEIAILKDGAVIGASVVSEYPVLIRAYADDLDEIEIEACYIPKSEHAERKLIKNIDLGIVCLSSGVFEINAKGPAVLKTIKVHPNPVKTWSRISIDTDKKCSVQMNIYNLRGQLVKSFSHEMKSAGTHSVLWDGKDASGNKLASGVYLIKAISGRESKTTKLMLIN